MAKKTKEKNGEKVKKCTAVYLLMCRREGAERMWKKIDGGLRAKETSERGWEEMKTGTKKRWRWRRKMKNMKG